MTSKNTLGFTLIEAMITVAILSILIGLVAPNFSSFIIKMRVDNEISEMQRMIQIGRNHAVNLGKVTVLCPLTSSGQCSNDWSRALTVFHDNNDNGQFDSDDEILKEKGATTHNDLVISSESLISFSPTGQNALRTNQTLIYCPIIDRQYARGIEVNPSGRSSTSNKSASGEKEFFNSGNEVSC